MIKFCPKCEKDVEVIQKDITENYRVSGVPVTIIVNESVCPNCNEIISDDEQNTKILELIYKEYERIIS